MLPHLPTEMTHCVDWERGASLLSFSDDCDDTGLSFLDHAGFASDVANEEELFNGVTHGGLWTPFCHSVRDLHSAAASYSSTVSTEVPNAEHVHELLQDTGRERTGKKRKTTTSLCSISSENRFPVVCPNTQCRNDDKLEFEPLKGCGGTRRGFLCKCGARFSQRMRREDEWTEAYGRDDPLIQDCFARSVREIKEGMPKIDKLPILKPKPLTIGVAKFDFDGPLYSLEADVDASLLLSFQAGQRVIIDEANSNDAWSTGKLENESHSGYFPTSYVRKGTCKRNNRCVKNNRHKGACKFR